MVPMYIHIPYCTKKCGYCSFYSVENEGVPDLYIEALTAFIKHYRKLYGAPGTLYIGGGAQPAYAGAAGQHRIRGRPRARRGDYTGA